MKCGWVSVVCDSRPRSSLARSRRGAVVRVVHLLLGRLEHAALCVDGLDGLVRSVPNMCGQCV